MEPAVLLNLGDEIDAGTCYGLPQCLRKIIGAFCGIVFQTNLGAERFICRSYAEIHQQHRDAFLRLDVGGQIDACDHLGDWMRADILQVEPEKRQMRIHYQGWDPKWDEWIILPSERLAILGTHTPSLNVPIIPELGITGSLRMDDFRFNGRNAHFNAICILGSMSVSIHHFDKTCIVHMLSHEVVVFKLHSATAFRYADGYHTAIVYDGDHVPRLVISTFE